MVSTTVFAFLHYKMEILEYIAGGGSIRTLMKAGVVPERLIGLITLDIVHALIYLHNSNIIHRDVKGKYQKFLAL